MLPQFLHPDIANFIRERAQSKENGWKWPHYLDSFSDRSIKQCWLARDENNSKRKGVLRALLSDSLCKRLSAAYIEWKYYSVLSDAFHGIIGFSLYNPEVKFSRIAEGGMLCVIAGETRTREKILNRRITAAEQFVWMKLFPLSSLQGLKDNVIKAEHGQAKLSLEDAPERNNGRIELSEGDDIHVVAEFHGPAHGPAPLIGGGMNPLPGGHWIVNNRMPCGMTTGTLSVNKSVTKGTSVNSEWINAPAYFEHSYGLNPLPWQGWDFFFAPLVDMRGGAVLQSYRNCQALKQLDVTWTSTADGALQATAFNGAELSIEWSQREYDQNLAAWIPRQRILRGKNARYEITLTNTIELTLPFLRPQTAAVRCFFIGEQMGSASWTLKNLKGEVIEEQTDIRAGGEVAYARFPSLGRLHQPFPV